MSHILPFKWPFCCQNRNHFEHSKEFSALQLQPHSALLCCFVSSFCSISLTYPQKYTSKTPTHTYSAHTHTSSLPIQPLSPAEGMIFCQPTIHTLPAHSSTSLIWFYIWSSLFPTKISLSLFLCPSFSSKLFNFSSHSFCCCCCCCLPLNWKYSQVPEAVEAV